MMTKRHPALSWLDQGAIEERVVAELVVTEVPRTVDGHWSQLAEDAALARSADHRVAEDVAMMRSGPYTWSEIGRELGVTTQAAQQRFGKLPPPPEKRTHEVEGAGRLCFAHLRRDRTAWGCACGEIGPLDWH